MQLKITSGAVSLSGDDILKDINVEINTTDKVGIIGRNGSGKTTLLKALAGIYDVTPALSRSVTNGAVLGMLDQMAFKDDSKTLLEEIRSAYSEILETKEKLNIALDKMQEEQSEENIKNYTLILDVFTNLGGFYFEKEYESALKKFGFEERDKSKKLSEFSGGQRTKIAFLKLLLSKPDLLLLDEPTNHLDLEAIAWLESYIREYKKAVAVVSHDRSFLDATVTKIYDIENHKTFLYNGNYSYFAAEKKKRKELMQKKYEQALSEIKKTNELAERFRYKATKARMVQSKLKQLEKTEIPEAPEKSSERTLRFNLEPKYKSSETVLTVTDLEIGYDKALYKTDFCIKRGDRVGVIGGNGLGKSTLLKTIAGVIPKIGGDVSFGERVSIGYFDQQMAHFKGNICVLDDFFETYPSFSEFEARSMLGKFLFTGEEVFKTLDMLSGGEKVRLALCKLFIKQPNFLILDEPTNHMDIESKEALEDILLSYGGTLLFVSHDRYFIRKISDKLIDFKTDEIKFYEYGYSQYLSENQEQKEEIKEEKKPKRENKKYQTPGKIKAKREQALIKTEAEISKLEKRQEELKELLNDGEIQSDYIKLQEISAEIKQNDELLLNLMEKWEELSS